MKSSWWISKFIRIYWDRLCKITNILHKTFWAGSPVFKPRPPTV